MSRYTIRTESGHLLAYGWDRPLKEYFVQLLKTDEMMDKEEAETGKLARPEVFWIGNRTTITPLEGDEMNKRYTNEEIAEVLSRYEGVPEDHIELVRRGVPI